MPAERSVILPLKIVLGNLNYVVTVDFCAPRRWHRFNNRRSLDHRVSPSYFRLVKYTTRLFAEFLAVAFVGGIGFAVDVTGTSFILFPEIAAISYDVFTRPRGKWASQPWQLCVSETVVVICEGIQGNIGNNLNH